MDLEQLRVWKQKQEAGIFLRLREINHSTQSNEQEIIIIQALNLCPRQSLLLCHPLRTPTNSRILTTLTMAMMQELLLSRLKSELICVMRYSLYVIRTICVLLRLNMMSQTFLQHRVMFRNQRSF